jgi:hypothetical protein
MGTFNHPGRESWVTGGVVGGVVGGLVMSMFMIGMNLVKGMDVWMGAKMPGLPFLQERAMEPGFAAGPVFVGMLSHFAVAIGWGLLFALATSGLRKATTLALSPVFGLTVWLVMFYVLLPILGQGQVATMMPAGVAAFEHVLYGVGVGVGLLPFKRARGAREPSTSARAPVNVEGVTSSEGAPGHLVRRRAGMRTLDFPPSRSADDARSTFRK